MDYIIHPYEGVSLADGREIKFGMTPEQLHKLLGESDYQYPESEYTNLSGQRYDKLDLIIHQDYPNRLCCCIAIAPPSNAYLNDIPLLNRPYQEIELYLQQLGGEVIEAGHSYFMKSGVAILENIPNENEGVLVFATGYLDDWEKEQEMSAQRIAGDTRTDEEVKADIEALIFGSDYDFEKELEA